MYSLTVRRVYCICDNLIVRTLRSRRLGPNPGIDERSSVLGKEVLDLEDGVEDVAENSQVNLFETGKLYKKHVKETAERREALRHRIVEQKYFKQNTPNLLTWSEKAQIRYLHAEQPDEWPPERIAESFPVTPQTVEKLLKYPWQPASLERIARHDASAMRNWQELKEGTLEISPELREHFLKFSERNIPPLNKKSIKIDVTSKNMGEFQAIVDKCAKHQESSEKENTNFKTIEEKQPKTKQVVKDNNKRLTLDALTSRIKERMDSGNEVNEHDQLIVKDTLEKFGNNVGLASAFNEIDVYHKKTDMVNFSSKMNEGVLVKLYPQRIRIPKRAWKKGHTYRVEDCYYDDDGKFLYRVLGAAN